MLVPDSFRGWVRLLGVPIALLASIATTLPNSYLSDTLDVELVTNEPGVSEERRFAIDAAGHPAVSEASLTIEVALVPHRPGARAAVSLVGPDGKVVALGAADGGPTTLDDRSRLEWQDELRGSVCPGEDGCTRELAIRISDADIPGVGVHATITASLSFSSNDPPPGRVELREVTP